MVRQAVSFYVDPEVYKAYKAKCEQEGSSISHKVQNFMERQLNPVQWQLPKGEENVRAELARRRAHVKEARLQLEALGVNIREILDTLGVAEEPEELHNEDLFRLNILLSELSYATDEDPFDAIDRYMEECDSLTCALAELNPQLKPRYRLRLERLSEDETT